MKVISKEEEQAHYSAVLRGGFIGGTLGLGVGLLGVVAGMRRYPAVRQLTLPFRAFLVTSVGTFGAIVNAERYSNAFHLANNPMNFYKDQAQRDAEELRKQETPWQKFMQFGQQNRYSIVFGAWAASMGLALGLVSRNRFLSTPQKLVQARVYAQGLTLAVLVASAVFETSDARQGKGRWETIMVVDPNDPEHKNMIEKRVHKEEYEGQDLWRDMVAAEERRLAQRKEADAVAPKAN
ncbi:mitochondrial hypoxia responsive domain-containing protein [Xylaria bambusicola]|uniref:mitochondrial hypoxia responsive domain-containing protein n=1 Tax=Xylaria bambusicola TaxID=326684 RepID=UPI0020073CB3|nr:mitochondrial hypoxia responsive domain-containing protein [Xylaria bambusicola]KAI0517188.1 mitochondrial hypoxia responsive domain-containing protein [Xylaria bambusicola]